MAKLEVNTVINRPIAEVFDFLSNSENRPKWSSGSSEVKKISKGPIGAGTTYRLVRTFLGRRIEGESEVTEYEPYRRFSTKHKSRRMLVEAQVTFDCVEGGTRVTETVVAEPGGLFKLAGPLLVSMFKRRFEADFANLKDLMEAHAL
jgi:uncharacterized protein YndB with AHSA1/START domain